MIQPSNRWAMRSYPFKTLRSRLTVLLITPVVAILLTGGIWGFIHARSTLLRQWTEHVMLQLEQAANKIEAGLSRPMELMKIFGQSGVDGISADLPEVLVDKLKSLPGVVAVNVTWHGVPGTLQPEGRHKGMGRGRFMRFHRGTFTRILPPVVDETTGKQTVSINMILMDAEAGARAVAAFSGARIEAMEPA